MIPARFDYDVAESVDHAIELLGAGGGDAKLLAGAHSLIPAMKLRISRPAKLVDIGRLSDLSYVKDGGTHVANTREVGRIRVTGYESKGRINKRIRIELVDPD